MGGSIAATTANYSDVTVTYTPIPEPSTWLLAGLLGGLAALRRRNA
jgi:hypothetical protein